MNENFEGINLSPGAVSEFIESTSNLQTDLENSKSTLSSCWIGGSFDNFSKACNMEQEKLAELKGHLDRVVRLIELINEHNEKRRRRDALKAEIAALRSRMYYTEWDSERGENVTHERPGVRAEIARKEEEVRRLNERLDQIVQEIDSVTSI